MTVLPPLLVVESRDDTSPPPGLRVLPGGDEGLAAAFGHVLVASRLARGLRADDLLLHAPHGDTELPQSPAPRIWAPHLAGTSDGPRLVWEAGHVDALEMALDADAEDIFLWAAQPHAILAVAAAAPPAVAAPDSYLSLRWILAHPKAAGEAASSSIAFEHVSLHTTPAEMRRVRDLMCKALGLVEIPRPRSITVPGHWLACGPVRVHLNARPGVVQSRKGTAPNHVCFAVANLDAAQHAVEARGFACERAGSLDGQVWFRLDSGTVIELQPRSAG